MIENSPALGDFDIYIRDNDNFDPETDYHEIKDGMKRKVWPIEKGNRGRQTWRPEVGGKINRALPDFSRKALERDLVKIITYAK